MRNTFLNLAVEGLRFPAVSKGVSYLETMWDFPKIRVPYFEVLNVAALLVLWASLMRFFLIQAGTKKMTGSNNAFFLGVGGFFWVGCSCVLMVNLKAAST